ncbi:NAD(P)/FAD-dependent oxidoreductase [Curvivirga sp.]|uniref:NAD(P)/FAD-dependent oxidoreductase n=1 Tax=Curvivirga sp. TaxID=2856848 RepID=UPI003B58CD13
MEHMDTVVIGAGVVGLAIARKLALAGNDVLVLESESAIGTGTSARNSEVIHAGIYYPKGSLKAKFCVEGKRKLYEFCESRGVEFKNCQKLIVATDERQLNGLPAIKQKAEENGVDDLEFLTSDQAKALEPNLSTAGALLSPSTGIVDSHGLMLAFQGEAEDHGAMIAFNAPLISSEIQADGIVLNIGGDAPMKIKARQVVNSAGLFAPMLAANMDGLDEAFKPKAYICKGNYFTLAGKSPFSRLIYPMPNEAGLGVHITVDLGGQAKFGPDTEWLDKDLPELDDYPVNPLRGESFYEAVRSYWPDLEDGALQAGYSGMRPKLVGAGDAAGDFKIDGPETHNIPGLVNLFGIESPGLTSSMAIADYVESLLKG